MGARRGRPRAQYVNGERWRFCSGCNVICSVALYARDASKADGLGSQCRGCRATRKAAYDATHRPEKAAYNAQYNATHQSEKAARNAAYRDVNRAKLAVHNAARWATTRIDRACRKRGIHPLHLAGYLESIDYRCEVCSSRIWFTLEPSVSRRHQLVIDHDHSTGKPRCVCCASCNPALFRSSEGLPALRALLKRLKAGLTGATRPPLTVLRNDPATVARAIRCIVDEPAAYLSELPEPSVFECCGEGPVTGVEVVHRGRGFTVDLPWGGQGDDTLHLAPGRDGSGDEPDDGPGPSDEHVAQPGQLGLFDADGLA